MQDTEFQFPVISRTRRQKLLISAERALSAQQQMTSTQGKHIVHYTLETHSKHLRMQHYPQGDRIDKQTGAQYFYHCHRENIEQFEHGHFHCFMRYANIPKRIKPTPLTDWDKYIDNPMTHLVAISMSQYGQPIRLFTVNRWISSEIWYDSKHISAHLNRFKMSLTDSPYWQILDRWVESILHLFSPQIIWLHQERDKIIHKIQKNRSSSSESIYEDRGIEELSSITIDIQKQIQWLLEIP
jgi:hypothetical protein